MIFSIIRKFTLQLQKKRNELKKDKEADEIVRILKGLPHPTRTDSPGPW